MTPIDPPIEAALNRLPVHENVLGTVAIVDEAEACRLLGKSFSNPHATMKREEDEGAVLRITADGRAVYPVFQFDLEGQRVFPVMKALIAKAPRTWSSFKILHWLTRPHLEFAAPPATALGTDADRVLQAFQREIEPDVHG